MADSPPAASRCPRCGAAFRCGMGDTSPCACTSVRLDDTQRADLAARYTGCLCITCLSSLAASLATPLATSLVPEVPMPAPGPAAAPGPAER